MYWRAAELTTSPIEGVLDRAATGEATLEEILDQDDVIQERKSLNGRLVDL